MWLCWALPLPTSASSPSRPVHQMSFLERTDSPITSSNTTSNALLLKPNSCLVCTAVNTVISPVPPAFLLPSHLHQEHPRCPQGPTFLRLQGQTTQPSSLSHLSESFLFFLTELLGMILFTVKYVIIFFFFYSPGPSPDVLGSI